VTAPPRSGARMNNARSSSGQAHVRQEGVRGCPERTCEAAPGQRAMPVESTNSEAGLLKHEAGFAPDSAIAPIRRLRSSPGHAAESSFRPEFSRQHTAIWGQFRGHSNPPWGGPLTSLLPPSPAPAGSQRARYRPSMRPAACLSLETVDADLALGVAEVRRLIGER
jgi:hypothetical protein